MHRMEDTVANFGPGACSGLPASGKNRHPGDRPYTRQGLAPKSQGGNGTKLAIIQQLGGGMALKTEQNVILIHADTVIHYTNQTGTASFYLDINPTGSGIQRIFQQLLDHRSRPFHHLTGRNLVGKMFRKNTNS